MSNPKTLSSITHPLKKHFNISKGTSLSLFWLTNPGRDDAWVESRANKINACHIDNALFNVHSSNKGAVEPWLSGFLHYPDFFSQYGHECLLVTIKIWSHIVFKTTALKSAVNCQGFLLSKSKSSACACRITNEEHSNEFWLAQSCVVEICWNFTLYGLLGIVWKTKIVMSSKRKR